MVDETRVAGKLVMAMLIEMANGEPERLERIADVVAIMQSEAVNGRPKDRREIEAAADFISALLHRDADTPPPRVPMR